MVTDGHRIAPTMAVMSTILSVCLALNYIPNDRQLMHDCSPSDSSKSELREGSRSGITAGLRSANERQQQSTWITRFPLRWGFESSFEFSIDFSDCYSIVFAVSKFSVIQWSKDLIEFNWMQSNDERVHRRHWDTAMGPTSYRGDCRSQCGPQSVHHM